VVVEAGSESGSECMLAMNSPLATIQHGLCCASLGQAKNNKTGSRTKKT